MVTVPPLVLDRSTGVPLAVQLADALRAAAVGGALRAGDRLPSTRELATALQVSRTVTAGAFDQLLAEGWLEGRHGVGTFVVGVPGPAPAAVRAPTAPAVVPVPATIDLSAGAPCLAALDTAAWRRAWRAAGADPADRSPDPEGAPAFRAAVAEHLLRHRGVVAGAEAVLATAGTSAAVAELVALLPPGSRVGVEQPGYQGAVRAVRQAGHVVVPVPVDDGGLVVSALPDGLAAVFCTPAHQYPTGRRMSALRRTELVAWARERGAWLLEDDYDGELRYDVAPLPVLAAMGPDVVVHLGTASKVLTPTLGVGWLVGPPSVRAALVTRRRETGTRPALAGQRVLVALAEAGDLGRHLRRLRRELGDRRAEVLATLAAAGTAAQGDPAGAHLVVPLRDVATEAAVQARAAAAGVRVDGLARHHVDAPGAGPPHAGPQHASPQRAGLVLGWAAPSRADLGRGLRVVVDALG